MKKMKANISGVVQGVGFRHFVYRKAQALGVKGYVRNLYNGDVEVVAEGDEQELKEMLKDLRKGPMGAHVRNVDSEWTETKNEFSDFSVKF